MKNPELNDTYSEAETEARREAVLKRLLTMPHKPHEKLGDKDGNNRNGNGNRRRNKR